MQKAGDVLLQAHIDGKLQAVARDRVLRANLVDEPALRILLRCLVADLPAQVALVARFDPVLANRLVELVALLAQRLRLLGVLWPHIPQDVRKLWPRRVVPPRRDGQADSAHVDGGLLQGKRLVLRQVGRNRDVDVSAAGGLRLIDARLDLEGRDANQVLQLEVNPVAGLPGLRQDLGEDLRRIHAHVLHEGLAVAVEDEAPRGEDVLLDDVVLLGPPGELRSIDDLHLHEPDGQDPEHHQDRETQHHEVPVGTVAARSAGCLEAFVQDAHRLEIPAPLQRQSLPGPAGDSQRNVNHRK